MRLHAEVGDNVDSYSEDEMVASDAMHAVDGQCTRQELCLIDILLKTVGFHPFVYITYARRQTLLKVMHGR